MGGFLKAGAKGAAVGVITHGAAGLAAKAAAPVIQRVAPRIASKIKGSGGGKGGAPAKGNDKAKPQRVWMGDQRDPHEIVAAGGFRARGGTEDLYEYVARNRPSVYVSTSKSESVARDYTAKPSSRRGRVYEIVTPEEGIDVNKTIKAPYPAEREIAFRDLIPLKHIKRAYDVNHRTSTG